MAVFEWHSILPVSADEVYAWHARPGAFERLTPPWQRLRVLERRGGIEDGGVLVFQYRTGPMRGRWVALHEGNVPGRRFVDEQVLGPFASWRHTHSFEPAGEDSSALHDHVEYALPGAAATGRLGAVPARRALERLFRFRHRRTRDDLARHAGTHGKPRLKVAVSGANGMLGRNLSAFLTSGGHEVLRVVRGRAGGEGDVLWDPDRGELDAPALEGIDAFVHLAGESIDGRWTVAKKERILWSRAGTAALVARTLTHVERPPRVIVSASGVGAYGDRGDEVLTEQSASGDDFMADVCRRWEEAWEPAREAGIRVVNARFAVVLTRAGLVLPRLMIPFRLGVGGPIGDGRQWMSWVALDDLLGAILHVLYDEEVSGVVNVAAPSPVTNRELAKTLGHVMRRPALVPVPARAIDAAFGEMGRTLLLASQRVLPQRLTERGFGFFYPQLEDALRLELGHMRA